MRPKKATKCKCKLCGEMVEYGKIRAHLELWHPDELKDELRKLREQAWKEFLMGISEKGGIKFRPEDFKLSGGGSRKRYRPERIISEREFLTGERRTKDDLPKHLEKLNPKKRKKRESKASTTNHITKKYLGSGKRPRWFDDSPKRR
jgi:hypothetical protein